MTIQEHLQDKVNAWIAKQIWQSISTEKDNLTMREHKLATTREQFDFMRQRADELIRELVDAEETKD